MRSSALVLALSVGLSSCGASSAPVEAPSGPSDVAPAATAASDASDYERDARALLAWYAGTLRPLWVRLQEAYWASSTDVSDRHTGQRVGADAVYRAFTGSPYLIERTRDLLAHRDRLEPLTARQLDKILLAAAEAPGTEPDLVARRVALEARQSELLDGFQFCLERRGDRCRRPATANDIDDVLVDSRDLRARLRAWEASKEVGVPLGDGLIELRDVRNGVARALGFEDFMALQVADYGMTREEMVALMDGVLATTRPLFEQLHCWTKHELAQRYRQPVPAEMPAHWIGNRWAQEWPGLVASADLDDLFEQRDAEWIVKQAERFYVSMGFPALPETFWTKSDLYPVPADGPRRKNSHASAWHMDLETDVRSLMSVEPDARWFGTTHHELGHIYYYLSYSRPEVPLLLREGANRAFHEGIGTLIEIVAMQPAYLREIGVWPSDRQVDPVQVMLDHALTQSIVFLQFAAGTMTHFENDLYASGLGREELNARWWDYVRRYQGVVPPSERPANACDACTKTHINDDPAQYYDYALSVLILHQLHDHICREIVRADVHECSYWNRRDVGEYLRGILDRGATRDWRQVMRDATGRDLSADAMMAYYEPLRAWVTRQNQGRSCALPAPPR